MTNDPSDQPDDEFNSLIRNSISAVDDFIDIRWRKMKKRFGWEGTPTIQPYVGFANDDLAWFHGRVLTNPPKELPSERDGWWENLANMYQRIESDEVPGVSVEIDFGGKRHVVVTDDEGYFHLETKNTPDVRGRNPWRQIVMRIVDHSAITAEQSTVVSRMLTPVKSASFGIISDIDDTVLHTGITSLLTTARLTFLHNARTRKPLAGVGALYHALQTGMTPDSPEQNPIFYVSSSPWNLYDLLEDFLDLNDIPAGPIMLRDLGFDQNKFIQEGHDHKLDKALRIMSAFPDLPFVLFGDSGQEDAHLYAEAATKHPDQVKAIFIRDVDPGVSTDHDNAVAPFIEKSAAAGVPMHLIERSDQAAQIAVEMGLLPSTAVTAIAKHTTADLNRPKV